MKKNELQDTTPRSATIYDVAKEAGVSPSTVSHVINNTATISDLTREKVLEAIEALQYRPNNAARSLRKRDTNTIGLIVQDMTSEFYSIMYEELLLRAQKSGYILLILCGKNDMEQNAKNIDILIQQKVKGIIVVGSAVQASDLNKAQKCGIHIVLCDQYQPNYCSVEWNNYETMRRLVHSFVAEGYRKIAYLDNSARRQINQQQRYLGYAQGLRDEGLPPNEYMFELTGDETKYFATTKRFDRFVNSLLARPRDSWPEVILCAHDAIAMAIAYTARSAGLRIPEDFKVVGFDDTSHASFSTPRLSTVRQQPRLLANKTFDMLYAELCHEEHPRHVVLEQSIVIRESAPLLRDTLEREQLRYVFDTHDQPD